MAKGYNVQMLLMLSNTPIYQNKHDQCLMWSSRRDKTYAYNSHIAGKRRYDRKQSGYGGQTKVIFRKKVMATIRKVNSYFNNKPTI